MCWVNAEKIIQKITKRFGPGATFDGNGGGQSFMGLEYLQLLADYFRDPL
jgi:hypothetical protein